MKINALFSAQVPDSALPAVSIPASSIFPDAISDHLINGIGITSQLPGLDSHIFVINFLVDDFFISSNVVDATRPLGNSLDRAPNQLTLCHWMSRYAWEGTVKS